MFRNISSPARGAVVALALFGVTMLVVSTGVIAGPGDDDNATGASGATGPSGTVVPPIVLESLATATPGATLVPGILTPAESTPTAVADDRNRRGHDDDDDDRSGPNRGDDDDDDGDDHSGPNRGDDDDDYDDNDHRGRDDGDDDDD